MSTKVSLCFICDEMYVMPTVVAITSVLINKEYDDVYDIYVVANNLSDTSVEMLKKLGNETSQIILLETGDGDAKFDRFKMQGLWITTTDLFKFEIPNLLHAELDKVLYLDGDIIVQKSLLSVFEEDIENVYAGVIKDYGAVCEKDSYQKRLNINHSK